MFLEDLRKIGKINAFTGGNIMQRDHLNTLVDAVNSIIDAASRDAGANAAAAQTLLLTVVANGTAVDATFNDAYITP